MSDPITPLGPRQHAALFAWMAREVLARASDEGEALVRAGVRRYGQERGRRMALRATAAGHPLDMTHYLAYGEWRAAPGESARRLLQEAPDAHMEIVRCPWHASWQALGLMALGRLYCEEIDLALVRGFNPALMLEVERLLTAGAPCCEFIFHGVDLTQPVRLPAGILTVMPWDYHLGHLYWTLRRVLVAALGAVGEQAAQAALDTFAAHYGASAAAQVEAHQETDFSHI
jgi:hypothetical protein